MIKIKLNGKEIEVQEGLTILQVARENGIEIPTLCFDEELKPYGSCWVCVVQVVGRKGFVTSCGTTVSEGMEIITNSEEILNARKMALELLLSDHHADCEAPCKLACPDEVDVQSYVALIANNQQHEAVKVIKDTLPMPLSIGRVCPAFCERECRRTLVEEPIAIRQLKRYAADIDLNDYWSYIPPQEDSKGKHVAVVGAGPSGLTCGYYLTQKGYDVTVFEASPKPGGWLYYGIPEYRLPKEILAKEIELMCSNGMNIQTNKRLGEDFTLQDLSKRYDAVYLAIGAQNAVPMPVKGSDLPGSYLGVDYLRDLMLGKEVKTGKKVAVIGGGNTAIDCARTAKRLGADVTIIYRRTRKEMPAEAFEVRAAEEEGIKLQFLANPVEYIGDECGIRSVRIEKMQLGKPDSSGRQRPEPTGEFHIELFDMVIAAISQVPEVDLFAEERNKIDGKTLPITRWSTADVDEELLYTGLKNVFAGGDFRLGPSTAIEAIADGRRAAENIDYYLKNGYIDISLRPKRQFYSHRAKKLSEVDKTFYSLYEKISRVEMPELDPQERSSNFKEVEVGFSEQEAIKEAERCLECGCMVNYRCSLRDYATEYDVSDQFSFGTKNKYFLDNTHPYILRDANKCIDCGLCVRICSEVQGPGVLGYINRGFATVVKPEFGESLTKTACESCGKCVTLCPVGALTERNNTIKNYPLEDTVVNQNCGFCGLGCNISIRSSLGNISYVTHPDIYGFNKKNICFYGKFGWEVTAEEKRVTEPMLKTSRGWEKIDWRRASAILKDRMSRAKNRYFSISPHNSNEEILLMQEIAKNQELPLSSLTYRKIFTDDIFSQYRNNLTFDDLAKAEHLVIIGEVTQTLRVICRSEQRKGKKLTLINDKNNKFNRYADFLYQNEDLSKIIECMANELNNKEKCLQSLLKNQTNEQLKITPKTIFIYNRNRISEKVIYDIWHLAHQVCDFEEGSGVLETSDWMNVNGFRTFNVDTKTTLAKEESFLMTYGERLLERPFETDKGYIVAVDTHYDDNYPADLLLPKPTYLEIEGTSLSDDYRLTRFENSRKSPLFVSLLQIFFEAGLITIEKTEPSVWVPKSEKHISDKMAYEVINKEKVNLADIKRNELSMQPQCVTEILWQFLYEAKEKGHQDQTLT